MPYNSVEEAIAFHGAGGGGALSAPTRHSYDFASATVINMPAGASAVGNVITMPGGVSAVDADDAGALVLEWTLKDPWGADHVALDPRKNCIAGNLFMTYDSANPVPVDADVHIAAYLQCDGATLTNQRAAGMSASMTGGGSVVLLNGRLSRDETGAWSRALATATTKDTTDDLRGHSFTIGSAGASNVTDADPADIGGTVYGFAATVFMTAAGQIRGGASSSLFKFIDSFAFNDGSTADEIKLRLAIYQPLGTAGAIDFVVDLSGIFIQPGNVA